MSMRIRWLQLRVKDLDFDHGTICIVRADKVDAIVYPSLAPSPAAAVTCTGMVAEGPGRGPRRP